MNCRQFEDQIFDYLDGSLPPGQAPTAESHLARCAHCQATLAAHRRFAERLSRDMHADLPPFTLKPAAESRFQNALRTAAARRRRRELVWSTALAAGLALALRQPAPAVHAVAHEFSFDPLPTLQSQPSARPQTEHIKIFEVERLSRYTFDQQGGTVTDCLTQETRTDEATFVGP